MFQKNAPPIGMPEIITATANLRALWCVVGWASTISSRWQRGSKCFSAPPPIAEPNKKDWAFLLFVFTSAWGFDPQRTHGRDTAGHTTPIESDLKHALRCIMARQKPQKYHTPPRVSNPQNKSKGSEIPPPRERKGALARACAAASTRPLKFEPQIWPQMRQLSAVAAVL